MVTYLKLKLQQELASLLAGARQAHMPVRDKLVSSVAAFIAILLLMSMVHYVALQSSFSLLVLASMGASAFLLFAVPHSPMSQPWPLVGGHLVASAIGIGCAQVITGPSLATASTVALSMFAMHWLRCPHPPSVATAMIAVLGGPEVHALGWSFCYEVVAINVFIMLLLATGLNALIPGRRYPLLHTHHPHHAQFKQTHYTGYAELADEDLKWALKQMESAIDVTREDLLDIYEFAVEHAQARNKK